MMNIDKLREAWLQDNPKIFCFSNIFNFVQFCWAHKFTPYNSAVEFIQNNPVKDYIEGEDRVLRGYKMQFVSRDGKYKCMDMDIKRTGKETGERYVNINTISHLIYNGVKYVVE